MAASFRLAEAFVDISARGLSSVQGVFAKVREGISGLVSRASGFGSSLSGIFAGVGGIGVIRKFVQETIAEETAVSGLKSALAANGQEVQGNFERINNLAKALQRTTTVGDETTLMLAAQAANYGLVGEAIDDTVQAALGISQATGRAPEAILTGLAKFKASGGKELGPIQRALPETEGLGAGQLGDFLSTKATQGLEQMEDAAKTLGGQLKQLGNEFGDLLQDAQLGSVFRSVTDSLRSVVDWLRALSPEAQNLIGKLVLGVAAFATLGLVIGPVASALGLFAGIIATISLHPVIAGVTALAAGLLYLLVPGETVGEKLSTAWAFIEGAVSSAWATIEPILTNLGDLFTAIGQTAGEMFTALVTSITEAASEFSIFGVTGSQAWEFIKNAAKVAVDYIQLGIDTIIVVIQNWRDSLELVGIAFQVAGIRAWSGMQALWENLKLLGEWFLNNWVEFFSDAFNNIITLAQNFGGLLSRFFSAVWEKIKDPFSEFTFDIAGEWEKLFKGMQKTTEDLPKFVDRAVSDTERALVDRANEIKEKFAGKIGERQQVRLELEAGKEIEKVEKEIKAKTQISVAGGAGKEKEFKAEFLGLAEFSQKIQMAISGVDKDKIAKDQLKEQKETKDILKKIEAKPNAGQALVGA